MAFVEAKRRSKGTRMRCPPILRFEGRDTVISTQVRFIERLLNTKPYMPVVAESMFEQSLHARMLLSAAE
jgi:hypothetical protein